MQQLMANTSQATRLARRIYVGSLNYELTEEHLQGPFSAFGSIVKIDMPRVGLT
jgi:RNA recognition motif-containing protein